MKRIVISPSLLEKEFSSPSLCHNYSTLPQDHSFMAPTPVAAGDQQGTEKTCTQARGPFSNKDLMLIKPVRRQTGFARGVLVDS